MSGVCFFYNSPQFLGQTVFIKRGVNQGQMGQVVRELENEYYEISHGDFEDKTVKVHRSDFLVHRYRKVKMSVSRG